MRAAAVALGLGLLASLAAAGCSDPCCTYDGRSIPLRRGPQGELLALAVEGDATAGASSAAASLVLVDTGSSLSLWNQPNPPSPARLARRTLSLLDAAAARTPTPVRAVLRDVGSFGVPLTPVGQGPDGAVQAVIAGDTLSRFSVDFSFDAQPTMSLSASQPADSGFLADAGYAVLRARRYGGGQVDALGAPDFLGLRGPASVPSTRLVVRACAAPAAWAPTDPLPERCCPGDERTLASGTDLALVLGTGFGPTVLSRSSWSRVAARLSAPVAERSGELFHPGAGAIPATFVTLPRLALVDQEASNRDDPGPCVELGQARRLEQVAVRQAAAFTSASPSAACALPCDQSTPSLTGTASAARNSAGYVALEGALTVAIVPDETPFLQALRAEIRPEGPDVDGVLGASALTGTEVEVDYISSPARLIVSCLQAASAEGTPCRVAGRCRRIEKQGDTHLCFGLPRHGLPEMCDNLSSTCQ